MGVLSWTVILRFLVAILLYASVTRTVKLNMPTVIGIPDISPVEELRERPEGNEPLVIDQTKGDLPYWTLSGSEYVLSTKPPKKKSVIINGGILPPVNLPGFGITLAQIKAVPRWL